MRRILWALLLVSLLPAAVLAYGRIRSEGTQRTVAMIMDELALRDQAHALGLDVFDLVLEYRDLGLSGIAVYEETPESLAESGRIAMMRGYELRAMAAAAGEEPPPIPGSSTVVSELEAGALDALGKLDPVPRSFEWQDRTWHVLPGDTVETLPLGPDRERIDRYRAAGLEVAYRPRNHQLLGRVGGDYPEEARYLIYAALEVAGQPDLLDQAVAASQPYLTGIIEGTEQFGMVDIAGKVPTVRLLSFNQDYINQRLQPFDLVDKYLLAANERNITLLYLRPYTEPQLGNLLANTRELVSSLRAQLEREGFAVGSLRTIHSDYVPNTFLRAASAAGILAALALLALAYPAPWGIVVALALAALGILAGGFDWSALALTAALVFPVLGYSYLRERLVSLGLATLISLAGALLLVAVGSDQASMSGVAPFRGVAATLVVPPALFIFQYALRYRRPAEWIRELWGYRVRLGDIVLVLVAGAALALVVLRRGNFPVIGASEAELAFRDWLSDLFVRPRFKELLGHPLAVLGLSGGEWPAWIRGALLTGGVIAQASILNSFSHYHTPLLVSLQRTLIAVILGLVIGLVLLPIVRLAVRLVRNWLARPIRAAH